jgi:hypothetical protein
MPSYKIIPTETSRLDPETLQERVNSVRPQGSKSLTGL